MQQTYHGSCHCGRVRFRIEADLSAAKLFDGKNWEAAQEARLRGSTPRS